ncbi:MAG TPA: hypothetical protein VFL29_10955 [Candidatus Dormibacteraeota bacterium]|nr:hypothetical protein [Candidatus Dormibacteraeota bacterium]
MAMDGWGTIGSPWQELSYLDRVLGLLSRPVPVGDGLPAGLRDELRELGVSAGRPLRRKRLIEQVWQRKRPLLRQLGALDDDPLPPCA